jgi:type I restriction-modification system DNA methylase subunit
MSEDLFDFHPNMKEMARILGKAKSKAISPDDRGAVILTLFLHYLQDNAETLQLDYDKKFNYVDMAKAFDTAYFNVNEYKEFVIDLAKRVGMQHAPFKLFLESISTASMSAALKAFSTFDDAFVESDPSENKIGREINEALRKIGGSFLGSNEFSSLYVDSYLCSQLAQHKIKEIPKEHISVCDPACGQGGMVLLLFEDIGDTIEHVGFYDIASECVCSSAMRLYLSGFRGTFDLRVADTLDESFRPNTTFDVVLADAPTNASDSKAYPYEWRDNGESVQVLITNPEALCVIRAQNLMDRQTGIVVMKLTSYLSFAGGAITNVRRSLIDGRLLDCSVEFNGKRSNPLMKKEASMVLVLDAAGRKTKRDAAFLMLADVWDYVPEGVPILNEPKLTIDAVIEKIVAREPDPGKVAIVSYERIKQDSLLSFRLPSYESTVDIEQELAQSASFADAYQAWLEAEESVGRAEKELKSKLGGFGLGQ